MSLTINTNLSSLMVQLSLKKSSADLNRSIERMTTGFKINSAKDDAAGFAVSSKMGVDLSSYAVVKDNTAMGLSLINTATSSLDLVTTHLQRIRDLTEEASNGTYGADSRDAIQAEINARTEEINRIMSTTEYNGIKLFEGGVDGGSFINDIAQLTEDEAIAQGYILIKTADDLNNMRNNLWRGYKYILMNDIDLSGNDWSSVGDYYDKFKGELNGNGHVIKNLNNNLFGYTDTTSVIKNLGIEDIKIVRTNSNSRAAALAENSNGVISNCYATGEFSGDILAGGLVEWGYGEISQCYTDVKINSSSTTIGGIAGVLSGAKIVDCFSTSDITGRCWVGGLVGSLRSGASIENSYFTGGVHLTDNPGVAQYLGGLVGGTEGNVVISNSYTLGSISYTSRSSYVGGLVGDDNGSSGTITTSNNYWDAVSTGINNAVAGEWGRPSTPAGCYGVDSSTINAKIADGTLPKFDLHGGNAGTTSGITFQVGIDSSANSQISVDTSISINLNVDVSTTTSASNALSAIDAVIKQVTEKQTQLGAVSNRLDSVSDSIDISIQNLTSSLSTIRDADIAKESSSYIKAQILRQASASLLATANQTPAIALNLI